jgi:ABC-type antimicrobial peptide transport system permease subunit
VAVVNETFVRRYFPDGNPIGRHFGRNGAAHANDFEIVGVVRDAKYGEPGADVRPMFFVPLSQTIRYTGDIPNKIEESSRYVGSIELHVQGDPDAIGPQIRAALAEVDPDLPPIRMTSVAGLIGITTSERTLIARLSAVFGVIALLLAGVGLYGVTAYRVAQRRTEIGLRMALGATRSEIAATVVRSACAHAGLGLLIGVPVALLAAWTLRAQLYGVSAFDKAALGAAVALIASVTILASALPARRASRLDPIIALRQD